MAARSAAIASPRPIPSILALSDFRFVSLWGSPGGKEQFLRSGWRKRERHRSLDGELLLIRAARARNVRRTKRRHGLERARRKPCGPFFYGHRSLHRPSHVPFSPIRSGIVPSRLGLPESSGFSDCELICKLNHLYYLCRKGDKSGICVVKSICVGESSFFLFIDTAGG